MAEKIYVRLDVDNAGDGIELALLKSDYENAQNLHDKIQINVNLALKYIQKKDSVTVLMKGCDDILFSIDRNNYDLKFLEKLSREFKLRSGISLSIGVGTSLVECIMNLKVAKLSGKDKIVENVKS
tara:strand:- start:547 stop:924 length:378 start_codon:yes stop_codon:yes gene_type:complete